MSFCLLPSLVTRISPGSNPSDLTVCVNSKRFLFPRPISVVTCAHLKSVLVGKGAYGLPACTMVSVRPLLDVKQKVGSTYISVLLKFESAALPCIHLRRLGLRNNRVSVSHLTGSRLGHITTPSMHGNIASVGKHSFAQLTCRHLIDVDADVSKTSAGRLRNV
jgi:hypothetical protein